MDEKYSYIKNVGIEEYKGTPPEDKEGKNLMMEAGDWGFL